MEKRGKKVSPTPSRQGREDIRTGLSVEAIKQSVIYDLYFHLAKVPHTATLNDWYMALAYTVRDRMIQRWMKTLRNFTEDLTVIAYLSSEFLVGPQLGINLINLDIYEEVFQAEKEIRDGWQIAMTEKWLRPGNPWEIPRPEITYNVSLGGHTDSYYDEQDYFRVRWTPKFSIKGIAHDFPISGYRVGITNLLRLWKSEAIESFEFEAFNTGDYFGAVNEKIASESISKILYPDDEPYAGKQLRLAQQYFFVSCSLQDMIRLHLLRWKSIDSFSTSFAVHLNDSDPAIAVAELMRLLVDEHLVSWEKAWYITQNTFSYTNHAVLPEALEKWPLPLFSGILPRHLEIIHEINRRFLDEISLRYPDDNDNLARLSLIDESDQKYIRMAYLASLGSQ